MRAVRVALICAVILLLAPAVILAYIGVMGGTVTKDQGNGAFTLFALAVPVIAVIGVTWGDK